MRVWITGVGITSSLGLAAPETFTRLVKGERGLSVIDLFDTSAQRASLGAQVRGVDFPKGDGLPWSRATAFAHRAAKEALDHSGIDPHAMRVGLIVGGTTAGMFENEVRVSQMMAGKAKRVPHPELLSQPLSSTTDTLSATLGRFARTRNVASACSSGVTALSLAMAWLLDDDLDAVLCGGADALCRLTLSGFNALSAIDPEPCRPFDRSRRGLNLGEGAGFVVLERAAAVTKRGKVPLCELAGSALAAEARHITNPESDGSTAARVMREALARAGVGTSEVDYINAHGTGTPLNDAMESTAITTVFGKDTDRVWVSSSKAQIGHTLAAAGAIEAVIAAMCVTERVLPPTAGLIDPDPACALRHVREAVRVPRVRAVVSSSFGFGGMDGALVITEPELARERHVTRRAVAISRAHVIGPRGGGDASGLSSGEPASGAAPDSAMVLDAGKARRLDRAARLCAAVTHAVLDGEEVERGSCGVVFGSAFSSVDEAASFVQRIFEKGPRLASPFEFPNLVPSSPVGHASIYENLRGPALATADLGVSGESAIATAIELLAAGDADAFVAGAIAVRSELIDEVFHPLCDDGATHAPRTECCAAVLLEATPPSDRDGISIEVRIARSAEELSLPSPRAGARVFGAVSKRAIASMVAHSLWRDVAIESVEVGVGSNEATGAAAVAAALLAIERDETSHALAVGAREGVIYAFVLERSTRLRPETTT